MNGHIVSKIKSAFYITCPVDNRDGDVIDRDANVIIVIDYYAHCINFKTIRVQHLMFVA